MVNVGNLVKNIDTLDYDCGVVLEINVNITEELFAAGVDIELSDLEAACAETSPAGARVMWGCGDISVHYFDELEVINEKIPKTSILV